MKFPVRQVDAPDCQLNWDDLLSQINGGGISGPQGVAGPSGATGSQGPAGSNGTNGLDGSAGALDGGAPDSLYGGLTALSGGTV